MKRLLAVILVGLLLIAGLMPAVYAESTAAQKAVSGRMQNGFRWTFNPNDGILTIYGNGEMPAINEPVPWEAYRDQIIMIIISDGIKSLSDSCFAGTLNLESVLISPTVVEAGSKLFDGCDKLRFIGYEGNLAVLQNILSKNDIAGIEMGNYTIEKGENGQITYKTYVLDDGTKVTLLEGAVKKEYSVGDVDISYTEYDDGTRELVLSIYNVNGIDAIKYTHENSSEDTEEGKLPKSFYSPSKYLSVEDAEKKEYHIKYNTNGEILSITSNGKAVNDVESGEISTIKSGNKVLIDNVVLHMGNVTQTTIFDQKTQKETSEKQVTKEGSIFTLSYDQNTVTAFDVVYAGNELNALKSYGLRKNDDGTSTSFFSLTDGRTQTNIQDDNTKKIIKTIIDYDDTTDKEFTRITATYNEDGSKTVEALYKPDNSLKIEKSTQYYDTNGNERYEVVYIEGNEDGYKTNTIFYENDVRTKSVTEYLPGNTFTTATKEYSNGVTMKTTYEYSENNDGNVAAILYHDSQSYVYSDSDGNYTYLYNTELIDSDGTNEIRTYVIEKNERLVQSISIFYDTNGNKDHIRYLFETNQYGVRSQNDYYNDNDEVYKIEYKYNPAVTGYDSRVSDSDGTKYYFPKNDKGLRIVYEFDVNNNMRRQYYLNDDDLETDENGNVLNARNISNTITGSNGVNSASGSAQIVE